MTVLSAAQRKSLEAVVVEARRVVEAACADRVAALGVASDRAPVGSSEQDRQLRRGLRARARQLGSVNVLITEAGFEHWHRMLFARLLADNGLLVDDGAGQPVSMAELTEYAAELGESDVWELAARFASAMLPGIFKQDDPVLHMRLPVETRHKLEALLDQLPVAVTTAEDTLGWVYQHWQTQRKKEINESERKIGGADLAPVTQLFTENYMVRFLLENSLGAWWAARHPDSPLIDEWDFLRTNDDGSPAAGAFSGWPENVAEVTVMDPCCGSGHFLVAAFGMLWRMRVEEEGLAPPDAQDAVLRANLFGLELDPRCTQIAMFALAVEAWKAGGLRSLPLPNIACSGISASAPLEEWTDLASGDALLELALARLHKLFTDADTLGSLIDPVRAAEDAGLESVDWQDIEPLLEKALSLDSNNADSVSTAVFGEAVAAIVQAATYLSRKYTLVLTNVPYLARGKQSDVMRSYSSAQHAPAAADLATTFLDRCGRFLGSGSTLAAVSPQNWLLQPRYADVRVALLDKYRWRLVCRLGDGAFSSISGAVVNVMLTIFENGSTDIEGQIRVIDAQTVKSTSLKSECLAHGPIEEVSQAQQRLVANRVITLEPVSSLPLLSDFAYGLGGITTGDSPHFRRCFWELASISGGWALQQSTPRVTAPYTGRELVLLWEEGEGELARAAENAGATIAGRAAWGSDGIAVQKMGDLPVTLYQGHPFENVAVVIKPKTPELLAPIWAFAESGQLAIEIRKVDKGIGVSCNTAVKVPFDIDRWKVIAEKRFPHGLPEPSSDDPTQWLFKGTVGGSREPLQVAVARLTGYRWPDQESGPLDDLVDDDGIVCIPAVGGEEPAELRLRAVLAAAYGDDWSPSLLNALLAGAGGKQGDLTGWLRKSFFQNHIKVFDNRPFIWQIWDGTDNGFSALVNYHKLDRKLLERLTYDYLGSWWIERQRDELRREVSGADTRLVAAQALKQKLELILAGEPPFDIYARWKELAEQPIGWDPDLDDGVRINIRPFITAGILRARPNIHWKKDRGKNPDGSERLNDVHSTLAEKKAARQGDTP